MDDYIKAFQKQPLTAGVSFYFTHKKPWNPPFPMLNLSLLSMQVSSNNEIHTIFSGKKDWLHNILPWQAPPLIKILAKQTNNSKRSNIHINTYILINEILYYLLNIMI